MAGSLDLGKQIGPLPMGAWFAVVGTGLAIALYTKNQETASADPTVTRDDSGALTGTDAVGTGVNGQWVDVTPPTTAPADAAPTDNDEWGRQAINWLIANNYDAAASQSAISKALQGADNMSVREYAIWNAALRHMGSPPFPVDVPPPVSVPGPTGGTPKPKPPVKSTHPVRVYTIVKGDTLAGVSFKMYKNKSKWRRIYAANSHGKKRTPQLSNPGFLQPRDTKGNLNRWAGRNLVIPAG